MGMGVARVVVGLAAASLLALACESAIAKPTAAHKAAHRTAVKKPAASHPKAAQPSPAVVGAYAAMPETDRLAIKGDLALLGLYEGSGGADFDDQAIEAVKTFQKRNSGAETGILTAQEREALAAAAKLSAATSSGWRLIEDPASGARLGLPEKLVPRNSASRTGSRWTSAQGQIQIETFHLTEAALPALFEDEKKAAHRSVTSSTLKPDSFVISGVQGLKNFLVRATASGGEVRGVTILYDQATEGIMGPIAIATANSFVGFPDPNAAPLPGTRRKVEYGTAIVVSTRGDLIAPAQVTDDCQTVTVPGLGHAERVAADKANDLALLRLYGARNLVPAMLAGDSGDGGDLTLVGIADPVAQAGDGAVTKAVARLTAPGVEPAPKPGFSGAAAVDAQGRFVGMVDLKPPVVAGSGSSSQVATLVRVEAIRSFLQAQGIAPAVPPAAAAGRAAMDQSVMRVICVRK
jgi:hypothetical protein